MSWTDLCNPAVLDQRCRQPDGTSGFPVTSGTAQDHRHVDSGRTDLFGSSVVLHGRMLDRDGSTAQLVERELSTLPQRQLVAQAAVQIPLGIFLVGTGALTGGTGAAWSATFSLVAAYYVVYRGLVWLNWSMNYSEVTALESGELFERASALGSEGRREDRPAGDAPHAHTGTSQRVRDVRRQNRSHRKPRSAG